MMNLLIAGALFGIVAPTEPDVVQVCLRRDASEVSCAPVAPGGVALFTVQIVPGAIYTGVAKDASGNVSATSNPWPSLVGVAQERRSLAGLP